MMGGYRFKYISKKDRSVSPDWKKHLWGIPGVMFDESDLIEEISKMQYVKISSFMLALAQHLEQQAKKDTKRGRLRLASHVNRAVSALEQAGISLKDACLISPRS